MSKLDPQLAFLVDGGAADLLSTGDIQATFERFGLPKKAAGAGVEPSALSATDVTVLVQFSRDPADLIKAGMKIHAISGDVITGAIALSAVRKVESIPGVERIEAARSMHSELDLSLVETRANLVHVGPPGRRGSGVIVGICDSGCDFTHPSFRRTDGTSRILFIWDQALVPGAGEASPAGFGYGVEYSNAQINAALGTANPFATVRHRDPGAHGTHVTGIAAGDGSAPGQGRPGGTFVGVAPEADIIVVANASNGLEGLGTSASTLDAVNYIYQRAGTLALPSVINMSLGDNLGPHDGTSLLERGLDNLLGGAGRAFVKSAGNAGAARCHAQGNVATAATVDVAFNQPAGDASANQIDLWYRGGDTFRVSVVNPAGNVVGPVNVGVASTLALPGGNNVRIDHRNSDPFNGDRRVFMTFTPGAAGTMMAGNWTIRLLSVASPTGGAFDAWIQRGIVVPTFLAPHESSARTISTPGTAREVITAANYAARGSGLGSLASSSSRGPTRDGRAAPTVAAPGTLVISASAENGGGDPYIAMSGTSMSAPHVTGTIALMLQKSPTRTQAQIKACLESMARSDAQTGPVPNTAWGAGKMDSNAAVNCVPGRIVVSVAGGACRSVVSPCPSITTACVSVPRASCFVSVAQPLCGGGTVSVAAACLSRVACPSVVDGCPSTPGGCDIRSLACGARSIACGTGVVLPGMNLAARAGVSSLRVAQPLPEGWAQAGQGDEQLTLTDGYFEYDESWFDDGQ